MMDPELQREQREVQFALATVTKEIRNEQQRKRRCLTYLPAFGGSARLLRETIAVYYLSGYDIEMSCIYAQMRGGVDMQENTTNVVEDAFISWPVDDILRWKFPRNDQDKALRRKVLIFLAEKDTIVWIQQKNEENGFAPSISEVFAEYCRLLGDLAPPSITNKKPQKVVHRLRQTWHLSFRKYQPHDDTTPEERLISVRASALRFECIGFHVLV